MNKGKRLIPEQELKYLQDLIGYHNDPSAEWGGEGSTYSAGEGISIDESNVISIDSTVALKTDIETYTAGSGIDITSNVVSVDSTVALKSDLSTVAFTGSYSDLNGLPTIPSATSDLSNDSGFITNSVSDLSNYYDKTYIDNTVGDIESLLSAI